MSTSDDTTPSLEADFVALRKLRDDDASGALKEKFGYAEEPREWKDGEGDKIVTVEDGRVTELSLFWCRELVALPAAIGELGALTYLDLSDCSDIAALPAAIGELKALTKLNLSNCWSLAALPAVIGELKALTKLDLYNCSSLAALPAAIGELKALTKLNLQRCKSLAVLPAAIGELVTAQLFGRYLRTTRTWRRHSRSGPSSVVLKRSSAGKILEKLRLSLRPSSHRRILSGPRRTPAAKLLRVNGRSLMDL